MVYPAQVPGFQAQGFYVQTPAFVQTPGFYVYTLFPPAVGFVSQNSAHAASQAASQANQVLKNENIKSDKGEEDLKERVASGEYVLKDDVCKLLRSFFRKMHNGTATPDQEDRLIEYIAKNIL